MTFIHDDYSDEDLVGHSYVRDALINLIESTSGQARSSFTIGVFGDWGTGKTTMLRQIQARLSETAEHLPVWFNPWQFSQGDDIIRAFFQLLAEQIQGRIAREGEKQNGSLTALADAVRKVAASVRYKPGLEITLPLGSISLSHENRTRDATTYEGAKARLEEKHGTGYFDMIQFLRNAADGVDSRIIVFIDDLDRCAPDQAIQLLDALKVLLDIPNFVFIVGVAHRIIQNAVKQRYNDLYPEVDEGGEGANYLDKIFQFSFVLPHPDPQKIKDNLIRPVIPVVEGADVLVDLIIDVVGVNPRTLKRFMNVVNFAYNLAAIRFATEPDPADFEPIVKVAMIAFTMPDLYRQFERYPEALSWVNNALASFDAAKTDDLKAEILTGNRLVDDKINNQTAVKLHRILATGTARGSFDSVATARKFLGLSSSSLSFAAGHDVSEASSAPTKPAESGLVSLASRLVRIEPRPFVYSLAGAEVSLSRPLFVDPYLVTQAFYRSVTGLNPSEFQEDDHPVEHVSWIDAARFCNKLSANHGLTEVYDFDNLDSGVPAIRHDAQGFRLPTEAEWEFICASGSCADASIDDVAWYMKNAGATTRAVGLKLADQHGLFDMLGNVWEWCGDWYANEFKLGSGDPLGPERGYDKVCRGGSWANFANVVIPTHRSKKHPGTKDNNIGFRIVTTTALS